MTRAHTKFERTSNTTWARVKIEIVVGTCCAADLPQRTCVPSGGKEREHQKECASGALQTTLSHPGVCRQGSPWRPAAPLHPLREVPAAAELAVIWSELPAVVAWLNARRSFPAGESVLLETGPPLLESTRDAREHQCVL